MLADDDDCLRDLLSEAFIDEGFEVVSAEDGLEATDLMVAAKVTRGRSTPDVVITDLEMPGADGAEVISRLKIRWPSAKYLVLTGSTDESLRARAVEAGADAILEKPVNAAALCAYVQMVRAQRDERVVS